MTRCDGESIQPGAETVVVGMGDLEEDFQPFRSSRIHCHLTHCIQGSSEKPSLWGYGGILKGEAGWMSYSMKGARRIEIDGGEVRKNWSYFQKKAPLRAATEYTPRRQ